ncbi:MAG: peptidylprolyl isomerase [Phycisphaerales bacterium]
MRIPTATLIAFVACAAFAGAASAQENKPAAPAPAAPAPAAPAAPAAKSGPVFVVFQTTKGDILLELDPAKAPISVDNFMKYVKAGFYDGTVFHRVVPGFVVQGGGFDQNYKQKATNPPIKNEWTNGLKNLEGTISMARLPSPDSATSQFFLNLKNNTGLDGANGPGYAVFGRIVDGMEVMHVIGKAPSHQREVTVSDGGKQYFSDVPVEAIAITKAMEITPDEAAKRIAAKKAAPAAAPTTPATPNAPAKTATPAAPAAPASPAAPGEKK